MSNVSRSGIIPQCSLQSVTHFSYPLLLIVKCCLQDCSVLVKRMSQVINPCSFRVDCSVAKTVNLDGNQINVVSSLIILPFGRRSTNFSLSRKNELRQWAWHNFFPEIHVAQESISVTSVNTRFPEPSQRSLLFDERLWLLVSIVHMYTYTCLS